MEKRASARKKIRVWDVAGKSADHDADGFKIVAGHLSLMLESGEYVAVYAPGTWRNIERL